MKTWRNQSQFLVRFLRNRNLTLKPYHNPRSVRRNHDVVIEWYDTVRHRINIDGFAVVVVLYPSNYVLIHSRCCGSNKIIVYNRFKQLIEGIKALSISDRDREFLIKAIKNRELVFG